MSKMSKIITVASYAIYDIMKKLGFNNFKVKFNTKCT